MGTGCEKLMNVSPHPVTSAVLFAVARLGYVVNIRQDGGRYVATGYRDGETFVVRAADPYAAAVELAGQVGIELEDG